MIFLDTPLTLLLPVPTGGDGQLPVLWFGTNAAQLTVPIGDGGQLMSCTWPVLWLSTNAAQLSVPIGDGGQLTFLSPRSPARHPVQLTVPIGDEGRLMSSSPRSPAGPMS